MSKRALRERSEETEKRNKESIEKMVEALRNNPEISYHDLIDMGFHNVHTFYMVAKRRRLICPT